MPPTRIWSERADKGLGEKFFKHTLAYSDKEVAFFKTLSRPKTLHDTQLARAGFENLKRTMPARLSPSTSQPEPIWNWLSERATLVLDDVCYDGKIVHIHGRQVYVLISWKDGEQWRNQIYLVASSKPLFSDGTGLAWPGPGKPAPGVRSSDLYELHPEGREVLDQDLWMRPLNDLVIGVGPAPHIFVEVDVIQGNKVWIRSSVIRVVDTSRPKLYKGYRGDEEGIYRAIWYPKSKGKPFLKTSLGYQGHSEVWDRRNRAVLHSHWRQFKDIETWFKGERLFHYTLTEPEFFEFLFIPLNKSTWVSKPTAAEFKKRIAAADSRAYARFATLPHLEGVEGIEGSATEEQLEEATRNTLSGVPHRFTHPWSWTRVGGAMPLPRILHLDENGVIHDALRPFPIPDDGYYHVANSGLLITPQLASLYSTVGIRAHLVFAFTNVEETNAVFTQGNHLSDNKHCPYSAPRTLKPIFRDWIFEAFYVDYVKTMLTHQNQLLGEPVAVELVVFHPFLLCDGRVLQSYVDAIYRKPDGKLLLMDLKTLQAARDPSYIITANTKNMRQVVFNAGLFMLMTKIQIDEVALAYVTRMGTVSVLTWTLSECTEVMRSAVLDPRPGESRLWYRDGKVVQMADIGELAAIT